MFSKSGTYMYLKIQNLNQNVFVCPQSLNNLEGGLCIGYLDNK